MARHIPTRAAAATLVATAALLLLTASACRGRRISDMTPSGDTVELRVERADSVSPAPADSVTPAPAESLP